MKAKRLERILIGGMLGLVLSIILAEYLSQTLLTQYQSLTVWRSVFGPDPNQVTSILAKISWAIFFVLSWLMFLKLDFFWVKTSSIQEETAKELSEEKAEKVEKGRTESEKSYGEETEGCSKEQKGCEEEDSFTSVKSEPEPDLEELRFAATLGIEKPFQEEKVKSAYRKLIAQYHPDRVSAMGPEIRDVAEVKAKEINEAYDYFSKKFETTD